MRRAKAIARPRLGDGLHDSNGPAHEEASGRSAAGVPAGGGAVFLFTMSNSRPSPGFASGRRTPRLSVPPKVRERSAENRWCGSPHRSRAMTRHARNTLRGVPRANDAGALASRRFAAASLRPRAQRQTTLASLAGHSAQAPGRSARGRDPVAARAQRELAFARGRRFRLRAFRPILLKTPSVSRNGGCLAPCSGKPKDNRPCRGTYPQAAFRFSRN
jgi:hypothetical protein